MTVGNSRTTERVRVAIQGAVQGVGFRPFVYRLATSLQLAGWVTNSPHGVLVEAEGDGASLRAFLVRLSKERPPRSFIQSFEPTFLDPTGYETFEIRPSLVGGAPSALVLPDIAICDDCLRELFDPADRRYRYPFINCTNCGPRFSIIEALPYDRPSTTMKAFAMCEVCRAEYEDPANRRFHAQPNACPQCGPQVALWATDGRVLEVRDAALRAAAEALCAGRIVAVKGLGGFHLMVDARNDGAVRALREKKGREEKPFALMYPALEAVQADCLVSPLEERLLLSAESPIVLLGRRPQDGPMGRTGRARLGEAQMDAATRRGEGVAETVAPGVLELGVMLPYTPLHHLLLVEVGFPVVATSGNLSDEPICTDEREAIGRLAGVADVFLVHNRPIARHVDDSVARVVLGRELVLRRARGYAPLPVSVAHERRPAADTSAPHPATTDQRPLTTDQRPGPTTNHQQPTTTLLAVGAHLKNTIAACVGPQVFVSQHVGDLETEQAFSAFRQVIDDFERLYAFSPSLVVCDRHPNYLSTAYAGQRGLPAIAVQHHEAHVLACIAENELRGPVLGVSWDGTGFGADGTIWGGEFLTVDGPACERRATLRTFGLAGGDQAVKEPRRSALGVLVEAFGDQVRGWSDIPSIAAFRPGELDVLRTLLARGINAPRTSSAGRLFDAVASLTGLCQRVRFEGQAAMAVQFAAAAAPEADREAYEIALGPVASRGSDLHTTYPGGHGQSPKTDTYDGGAACPEGNAAPAGGTASGSAASGSSSDLRTYAAPRSVVGSGLQPETIREPVVRPPDFRTLGVPAEALTRHGAKVGLPESKDLSQREASNEPGVRPPDFRTLGLPDSKDLIVLDWAPMVSDILVDVRHAVTATRIAAKFHNTLVNAIVAVATRVGLEQVVLTGGCFQNALLLQRSVVALRAAGLRPYWHQRIPPNDGGIALGQILGAIRQTETNR